MFKADGDASTLWARRVWRPKLFEADKVRQQEDLASGTPDPASLDAAELWQEDGGLWLPPLTRQQVCTALRIGESDLPDLADGQPKGEGDWWAQPWAENWVQQTLGAALDRLVARKTAIPYSGAPDPQFVSAKTDFLVVWAAQQVLRGKDKLFSPNQSRDVLQDEALYKNKLLMTPAQGALHFDRSEKFTDAMFLHVCRAIAAMPDGRPGFVTTTDGSVQCPIPAWLPPPHDIELWFKGATTWTPASAPAGAGAGAGAGATDTVSIPLSESKTGGDLQEIRISSASQRLYAFVQPASDTPGRGPIPA